MDTMGSAARTTAHPFPFPYFGAGDAAYSDHAEVYVRFARTPGARERGRIVDTAPAPLRGQVRWTEGQRQLALGSDEFVVDEGTHALNVATGAWLRAVHELCPVLVAYRPPDREAGGTRLSAWHDWSVGRVGTLTREFGEVAATDDARCDGGASDAVFVARGVLTMARDAGADVPARLLDWLEPGVEEVTALAAGDGEALDVLVAGLPPGRRPAVAERLTRSLRPGHPGEVAAFTVAARRLLDGPEVAPRIVVAIVQGALAARATGRGEAVAELLARLAGRVSTDPRAARRLRAEAWELRLEGRTATARELLAFLGEAAPDRAPGAAPRPPGSPAGPPGGGTAAGLRAAGRDECAESEYGRRSPAWPRPA